MTTTMSEHTATLLDSFCRSWLRDREAGDIPPAAVAVPVMAVPDEDPPSPRGAARLGAATLDARAGVGLPLGDTQPNPFERARRGLSHQHIQFGAGSMSGVLALDARQPAGPVDVTASGQAVLYFAESRFGYQPGDRVSGGLTVGGRPTPRLRLEGGLDTLIERPERWDGAIEEEGNLGRWELLVGGRVAYAFDALTLALSVKAPVYVHLTEAGDHDHGGAAGQLEYPAVLALTVARGFQVF